MTTVALYYYINHNASFDIHNTGIRGVTQVSRKGSTALPSYLFRMHIQNTSENPEIVLHAFKKPKSLINTCNSILM